MKNRIGLSLQHLLRYADEGEDTFNRIVIGANHECITTNLNTSVQWKYPSSHSRIKFKVMPIAGKVMLTMFWDSERVVLAHFHKHGENVNSASYCEVLLKLQMQFTENVQTNWQEGYCFVITMPDSIQPE
jgi:hypothetical protein